MREYYIWERVNTAHYITKFLWHNQNFSSQLGDQLENAVQMGVLTLKIKLPVTLPAKDGCIQE